MTQIVETKGGNLYEFLQLVISLWLYIYDLRGNMHGGVIDESYTLSN